MPEADQEIVRAELRMFADGVYAQQKTERGELREAVYLKNGNDFQAVFSYPATKNSSEVRAELGRGPDTLVVNLGGKTILRTKIPPHMLPKEVQGQFNLSNHPTTTSSAITVPSAAKEIVSEVTDVDWGSWLAGLGQLGLLRQMSDYESE